MIGTPGPRGRKKAAPVVITRKDKRLKKGLPLAAFMLTGGASAPVTATKAATNAAYNARTRRLVEQSEQTTADNTRPKRTADEAAAFRAEHVPGSKEYRQAHGQSGSWKLTF